MRVAVRLFAAAREAVGRARLDLSLPEGATAADCLAAVAALSSRPFPPCVVAVGLRVVDARHPLANGEEVAVLPPVSGGAEWMRIGDEAIDPSALISAVASEDHGGVVLFLGTVRGRTGDQSTVALEYEAYGEMALEVMATIAGEVRGRWPGAHLAMQHRTGRLAPGEAAVGVAASSGHRGEAFAAARYCIERVKAALPVWKREHGPGGAAQWIEHP